MSTVTFGFLDAALAKTGPTSGTAIAFTRNASFVGRAAWLSSGAGSEREFEISGSTDLTLSYNASNASAWELTVDGTVTTPTLTTGNVWSLLTCLSGASSGVTHRIKVKWLATTVSADEANFISATGPGTPTISYPTSSSVGPGPTAVSPRGNIYHFRDFPTNFRSEDIAAATFLLPAYQNSTVGGTHTFRVLGAVDEIRVFTFVNTLKRYSLYVNGTLDAGSPVTLTATSRYDWMSLKTGLGLSGTNDFQIHYSNDNAGTKGAVAYAVEFVGPSGSILVPTLDTSDSWAPRAKVCAYGDSIVEGNFGTAPQYTVKGWVELACHSLGKMAYNRGNSGQQVSTYLRDNTAQIPADSDIIILQGGCNDAANSVALATFKTAKQTEITNARARSASAKIYCMHILPRTDVTSPNRTNYNAQITQAAIDSADANIQVINTDNWINTGTDLADVAHPNDAGDAKIANRWIPQLSVTGYTIAAPATHAAGSASGNGTVTIASGATFTGDETITLTSNNGTDIITPSVGSPGTGAVTVTPVNGATSFTYTITRSTAGTSTLTQTNGQGWTNPGTAAYVASAAPTTTRKPQRSIFIVSRLPRKHKRPSRRAHTF